MGSAELEAALRREGIERARSIVSAAEEEVALARTASDAAWEQTRSRALLEVEATVEAQLAAERMRARRAARRLVLEARHRTIERVLGAVRERLAGLRERPHPLEELLAYAPEQEVEVEERPDGLVVRSGTVTIDGTLASRLERMRPLLAIRIQELSEERA
jgi:vacuolar-type H+-ATPase subunit E/Vma4